MCGIIGIVSKESFSLKDLLERLKLMEYRGYDSFGYYDLNKIERRAGQITLDASGETTLGIAHTRWATHGPPVEKNAHPHVSCNRKVVIAHNGILENFEYFKKNLMEKGHVFSSDTDSEVVAHYFEEKLQSGKKAEEAILDFLEEAQGTFAILMHIKEINGIYAIKRDSPLAYGTDGKKSIIASDIYAFSNITSEAIFFENDEFAFITHDKALFYNKAGVIKKSSVRVEKTSLPSQKNYYKHFMLKEIEETPMAMARLLKSLKTEQHENLKKLCGLIKSSKKVVFTACGTSYHAALIGAYFLHQLGYDAQAIISSEFNNYANIGKDSLVIALSQSGETMDVVESLKYSREKNARLASIVNVPYSTIQRMTGLSINLVCGQEVAVASTKSFSSQIALLATIAKELGLDVDISNIDSKVENLLEQKEDIKKIAESLSHQDHCYVIGRKLGYPISRETALKIKEVSYIHAEGMMAGELKHGTIALISQGTPVISIIEKRDFNIISSTKEVEARGARIIAITNSKDISYETKIFIDASNEPEFAILSSIAGQLLAYYCADFLRLPIDKPRNLAKSVTVK